MSEPTKPPPEAEGGRRRSLLDALESRLNLTEVFSILTSFGLKPESYTLTQIRDDVRKMKAHGLVERHGRRYAYRLTDKGDKVALMFVLFHKRVCGPLAHTLFEPNAASMVSPNTKLEAAYRKADRSIQKILQLLAA